MWGLLLGLLLALFGLVNIFQYRLSFLPSALYTLVSSLETLPFLWNQILFVLAGIFLWMDASRRTRVFNGMISIVAGLLAIVVGLGSFLQQKDILATQIPLGWNAYLSLIFGALLIYDSLAR